MRAAFTHLLPRIDSVCFNFYIGRLITLIIECVYAKSSNISYCDIFQARRRRGITLAIHAICVQFLSSVGNNVLTSWAEKGCRVLGERWLYAPNSMSIADSPYSFVVMRSLAVAIRHSKFALLMYYTFTYFHIPNRSQLGRYVASIITHPEGLELQSREF